MGPSDLRFSSLLWGVLCVLVLRFEFALAARLTPIEGTQPRSTWKGARVGTVYLREGKFVFEDGVSDSNGIAWGSYSDADSHPSYFGQLRIKTSDNHPDLVQMHAAGYMEAFLTHKRINNHFANVKAWLDEQSKDLEPIRNWMEAQDDWAHKMAKENSTAFWQQTALVLAQLDGLVAGYLEIAPAESALTRSDLLLLNGLGDLLDLLPALDPASRPDWSTMSPALMLQTLSLSGHCSALIKVNGDLTDIVFSHSSWFVYAGMNRIYKHYSFSLHTPSTASNRTSFSSYPGVLSSLDDFYLMDPEGSGLVMLQTTNSVLDMSLYDTITPESVLAWQRVRVANAMASGGREWAEALNTHNSGTYNNQYMVLDLKLFQPGKALSPDLLWVAEQIPGLVASEDRTAELERGYWPSYNVPYFRQVYDKSGYQQMVDKHASRGGGYKEATEGLDYQLAPRAKIFRRDAGKVEQLDELKSLMRSNGWPNDPYAGGSPLGAICSRGDLSPETPSAAGCYDTKVSSYQMAMRMEAEAVNGPTAAGLKPFSWAVSPFKNITHEGLPDVFDFRFELEAPQWSDWEAFLFGEIAVQ